MIEKIKIKGYKSIKDAELELKPINLLIGANGVGKSNFLSFFEFLNYLYEQKLQEYIALRGGQEKFLFQGLKKTIHIESYIYFAEYSNAYGFMLRAGREYPIFTEENLFYYSSYFDDKTNIAFNSKEAEIKYDTSYRANYIRELLNTFKKYHFHDTSEHSPFNTRSHIENDQYFLYKNGANLAAFLYGIYKKEPINYRRIIYTIQSIAPYFSDFYFQPNEGGYLRLQWTTKNDDIIYGATDLSDGTLRFIALCVLFLQPNLPKTIIIDEPELGLHPFAISKLSGMIKSVVSKKNQVIVATQSVDLINHFKAEDVLAVDQINGASEFHRVDKEHLEQWLEEYNIGDLWSRNIIEKGQPNR